MNQDKDSSDETEIKPSPAVLFTPSLKCPQAFVKERVDILSDNNWAIKKMNLDYSNSKQRSNSNKSLEEHFQAEEETEYSCTTPLDTVSLSTDLAPYMASCAETLASSVYDSEASSDSKLDDVTVISISSDDEERMIQNKAEDATQIVLKDSSNVINSDINHSKQSLSRSKSFTLECPSPLLLDALKDKRIGLEPSPESDKSDTPLNESCTNMRDPKTRIPVSKSLRFSLSERKSLEGKVVNPPLNYAEMNNIMPPKMQNKLPMPVLNVTKQYSESDTFFQDLSDTNTSSIIGMSMVKDNGNIKENFPLPDLNVTKKYMESDMFFEDLIGPNSSYIHEKTVLKNNPEVGNFSRLSSIIESEDTDKDAKCLTTPTPNQSFSFQINDSNVNNFLIKQEKLKSFLETFNRTNELGEILREDKELATENIDSVSIDTTANEKQNEGENYIQEETPEKVDSNYLIQIQISHQKDEINKLRLELNENKLNVQKMEAMKKRLQEQEHSICLLKHKLEMQQKDHTEWMQYMFELQSIELEKKIKLEIEKFMQKFHTTQPMDSTPTFSTNNPGNERYVNLFRTPSKKDIPIEVQDLDITGSDSSSSSVKTVIQAVNINSSPQKNLFSRNKHSPRKIIVPEKALEPDMKPKFDKISAIVKGFLTRRLMKTHKVQGVIKTIRDTTSTALQIHTDLDTHPPISRDAFHQDVQLSKRLLNQLNSACHEFSDIFFECSIKEQMALIAQSREMRNNPKPKVEAPKKETRLARTQSLTPSQIRGSTFSKIQKRKVESIGGRPKRTSASASPKQLTRRICRSSMISDVTHRSPKVASPSLFPSFSRQTPPKEAKSKKFDNRSPSFF